MKNNIRKNMIIVISWCLTLFILFIMGNYLYDDNEFATLGKEESFITYDSKKNGAKAMYLLASKMGYSVKRYEKPARFLDKYNNYTMIIIAPDLEILDSKKEMKYLTKWVKSGNSVVFYGEPDSLEMLFENYGLKKLLKNNINGVEKGFHYGEGRFVFSTDTSSFSNNGVKNLDNGVEFIRNLETAGNKKVLFNEFYHGIGDQGSVWDMFTSSGQIIVIQLFLGLFIFLYMKSRRFGKPEIVYQTVKRMENERLYALAKIYKRAKLLRPIFNIYVNKFEKDLMKYLEINNTKSRKVLLEATRNNKVLYNMSVHEIIESYGEYLKGINLKNEEIIGIIKTMDNIKKELYYIGR